MRSELSSFKLRFFDEHVRAVPTLGLDGCAFAGPGIDLRGDEARAVFAEAKPIREWLEAREPGIVLRTLSIDLVKLRVLVTLEAPNERPRVLRFDPPSANEIVDAAKPLLVTLEKATIRVLERRAAPPQ